MLDKAVRKVPLDKMTSEQSPEKGEGVRMRMPEERTFQAGRGAVCAKALWECLLNAFQELQASQYG